MLHHRLVPSNFRCLAMEAYPSNDGMTKAEQLTCQMPGCGTVLKKFKYLVQHLKTTHGFEDIELRSHWVYHGWLHERRKTGIISPEELQYVGLAYGPSGDVEESNFICRECEKKLSKSHCMKHMRTMHDLTDDVTKQWLAHKDSNLLKTLGVCTIRSSAKQPSARSHARCCCCVTRSRTLEQWLVDEGDSAECSNCAQPEEKAYLRILGEPSSTVVCLAQRCSRRVRAGRP